MADNHQPLGLYVSFHSDGTFLKDRVALLRPIEAHFRQAGFKTADLEETGAGGWSFWATKNSRSLQVLLCDFDVAPVEWVNDDSLPIDVSWYATVQEDPDGRSTYHHDFAVALDQAIRSIPNLRTVRWHADHTTLDDASHDR